MKLLQQILKEAGANTDGAITIVPAFGGYFKAVKKVEEFSPEKIVLTASKKRLTVTGENLRIDKYFQQDLLILGDVKGISYE